VEDPPYVDEHAIDVPAPRAQVWDALTSYVDETLASGHGTALTRLLGTSPASGFRVASRTPTERVELVGRHRFSHYRLVFSLSDSEPGATRLAATTYAAFPGPHGAAYRILVIRSCLHVLATRRMLRAVGDFETRNGLG
jgi:hypothetical protein